MAGQESFEPIFSTRGNKIWRRYGRTIIGRPDSEPRPIPLSRTEQQGAQFPINGLVELEQAVQSDQSIPMSPESVVEDLMTKPKQFAADQRNKEE
jgi:hypothetical protein